ncbi:hypothetical protein [Sphaerisporangium perillae]|uniref:hypothetical protein n=1 Tax=Sphaerisporangium perillae TaxID=2935860 RepID=UPI00200F026F|nr:hypothetical protein [Sphaerisporangium perillae]
MRTLFPALVAAGITVAGCSSGPVTATAADRASAVATPAKTVTTSPAPPTPSPAPLTRKQAALRYLAIVKPYDVGLERLEKAINGGLPVASLRSSAAKVAAANRAQIRHLQNTAWPAAVRAPIKELGAESLKAQPYWLRAARARTPAALIQEVLKASRHDGAKAAAKIRRLLQLEEYDENDYS